MIKERQRRSVFIIACWMSGAILNCALSNSSLLRCVIQKLMNTTHTHRQKYTQMDDAMYRTHLIKSNSEEPFPSFSAAQYSHYSVCNDIENLDASQRAEDLKVGEQSMQRKLRTTCDKHMRTGQDMLRSVRGDRTGQRKKEQAGLNQKRSKHRGDQMTKD